jgi:flagellar basal body P-ring protein FlgI
MPKNIEVMSEATAINTSKESDIKIDKKEAEIIDNQDFLCDSFANKDQEENYSLHVSSDEEMERTFARQETQVKVKPQSQQNLVVKKNARAMQNRRNQLAQKLKKIVNYDRHDVGRTFKKLVHTQSKISDRGQIRMIDPKLVYMEEKSKPNHRIEEKFTNDKEQYPPIYDMEAIEEMFGRN